MENEKKCVICGRKIIGYGCNPYPVKKTGECCKFCDKNVVIPKRIELYLKNREK